MTAETLESKPTAPGRAFWLAWGGFCMLMVLVGLQDGLLSGSRHWHWPLLDELLAMSIATAVAVSRWRAGPALDALLPTPQRWFVQAARPLWWMAPGFVVLLYGLRHAARALVGETYLHPSWPAVFGYECLKFAVFYALLSGVQFGQRSHQALAAERLRALRAEQLSAQASLLQLTQQVQPHFLFNALNTIAGLLHEDAKAADAALMRLAALMRATTDAAPEHCWSDELALGRAYAELMAQRFGPRVQLDWHDEPAAAGCRVPALSLQPLLENCFVHGVERRRGPVRIGVSARLVGDRLVLEVEDDAGTLPSTVSEGVGLANLRQRLAALYGTGASLSLSQVSPRGVAARLELPA
jgi:two-component system, LytTR family, sensor kinase